MFLEQLTFENVFCFLKIFKFYNIGIFFNKVEFKKIGKSLHQGLLKYCNIPAIQFKH